jgi:hypothetical protein
MAGARGHVASLLEPMDSFAYSPLTHTVLSLDSAHHSTLFFSFHSFHPEKDAMDYALSMVLLLLPPDLHLVHAGKQWLNPGSLNSSNIT